MALVERLDVLLAARSCACELFLRQNFANALHFVFAQYFSLKTADIAVKLAYIAYVLGHGGFECVIGVGKHDYRVKYVFRLP